MRAGVERALRNFVVRVPDINGDFAFTVEQVGSAEAALMALEESPPHLLLLDLKLPGMTGLELLDVIHEKKIDIAVVMITAYASIETAVQATRRGAYDFLPRPFTPAELRDTVRKAARHVVLAQEARKLAQEKRRVRFEFIRVVAHELKAPINAVEGYLRIMQSGAAGTDPAVQSRMVDRCIVRICGMRKMIEDLLDLTRIESGEKKRQIGPVDLREVAHLAIETATPDAQGKRVTLSLRAPDTLGLIADRQEMEIILNNLISNAVKYNKDEGRVEVRLSREGMVVRIQVEDTGIGMKPEDARQLFQDFVRVKSEQTRGILGSGLGLSIVRKLAALYEGDATVKSELGKGSTFEVTLNAPVS